jgi:ABC-type spermidine/putrescine transport system permease subunit II
MSALRNQRMNDSVQKRRKGMIETGKALVKSIAYRENVYGMVVGAILLSFIFYFSGAGIPYINWYIVPVVGMFFGLMIALITEKITPVSVEEIFAGKSLGMSFTEIMREIVIPNGRPGILERLNRRNLKFK